MHPTTNSPATAPSSPAVLRSLAPALAGVAFVALAVSEYVFPEQSEPFARAGDYVIEACFALGALASVAAVLVLDRMHRFVPRWGRFGRIAAAGYAVGNLLVGVSTGASLVSGRTVFGVAFLAGIALWLLGGIALGVALFRSGLILRLLAVALAIALPLTMALGPLGPVVNGLVWLALSLAMARVPVRP